MGRIARLGCCVESIQSQKFQRKTVLDLLRFLEDRRVLYSPFSREQPGKAITSVYQIRDRLGEDLVVLDEYSDAVMSIREMQASCRSFLNRADLLSPVHPNANMYVFPPNEQLIFEQALNALRRVFQARMDELYDGYKISRGSRPVDHGPIGAPIRIKSTEAPHRIGNLANSRSKTMKPAAPNRAERTRRCCRSSAGYPKTTIGYFPCRYYSLHIRQHA